MSEFYIYMKMINSYHVGTELSWFNYINIIIADALTTQGAKSSAPIILTTYNR